MNAEILAERKKQYAEWHRSTPGLYQSLDAFRKIILTDKKYKETRMILNEGGQSYTDGKAIVISMADCFLREIYGKEFWRMIEETLVMHESQHVLSTLLKESQDESKSFAEWFYQEYKFNRSIGEQLAFQFLNILEDGRIENIIANNYPGYANRFLFKNGEYRVLNTIRAKAKDGKEEFEHFMSEILSYAKCGAHAIGINLYHGEEMERQFLKIQNNIDRAVAANSCLDMLRYADRILKTVAPYIAKLLKEDSELANFLESLPIQFSGTMGGEEIDFNTNAVPGQGALRIVVRVVPDEDDEDGDGSDSNNNETQDGDKGKNTPQKKGQTNKNGSTQDSEDGDSEEKSRKSKAGKKKPDGNSDDTDDESGSGSKGEKPEDSGKDSQSGNSNGSGKKSSDNKDPVDRSNRCKNTGDDDDDDDFGDDDFGDQDSGDKNGNAEENGDPDGSGEDSENGDNQTSQNTPGTGENGNKADNNQSGSDQSSERDKSAEEDLNAKRIGREEVAAGTDMSGDFSNVEMLQQRGYTEEELREGLELIRKEREQEEKSRKLPPKVVSSTVTQRTVSRVKAIYGKDYKETIVPCGTKHLPPDLEREGAKLENDLKRILKIKYRDRFNTRKGLINANSLWKIPCQEDNLFCRRNKNSKPSVAIYLLIDNSGSMSSGSKSLAARRASAVIERAFSKCAACKIVLFASGMNVEHWIVKEFDQTGKYNFSFNSLDTVSATGGNRDGSSIRIAYSELQKRPEKKKFLIVLSDGLPSAYVSEREGKEDVRQAVAEARAAGMEVISIPFGSAQFIKDAEPDFVEMYRYNILSALVDDIPVVLGKLFKELLS